MRWLVVAGLVSLSTAAIAQPQDPYGPPAAPLPPPPPIQPTTANDQPTPADPVLAEQIAQSLVARAQELFDAQLYTDAKQLAIETTLRAPKGPSADHAHVLLEQIDAALGIAPQTSPEVTPSQDTVLPPVGIVVAPPHAEEPGTSRFSTRQISAYAHGGLLGGMIGATIGTAVSSDGGKQAGGAVALGLGGAVAGAFATDYAAKKLDWSEAQIRTAGSGSIWGGTIGAFIADIATGLEGTSGRQVMIGASIGGVVGGAAGAGLATQNKYTRGDIALVDTFAGIGAAGGLTIGMLMQPAQGEAYSLNVVLGTAAGVLTGLIAAPQTNTTPRRMLRVAGCAAIGLAVPFLLYAGIHSSTTTADDRVVGLLASGGMVAGTYVGFRVTSGMDEGQDVLAPDGAPPPPSHVDAPAAAVTRASDGTWSFGGLALAPLDRTLDDQQRGTQLALVGARF